MTTWPAHGMTPERWAAWLGVEMVRPSLGAALIEQVRRDLALMLPIEEGQLLDTTAPGPCAQW